MDRGYDVLHLRDTRIKTAIVGIASLLCIAITILALRAGIQQVFPHLYYMPIVLGAYWFPRKGFLNSILLGVIYLILVITLSASTPAIITSAVIRSMVFVGIGFVVSYLAGGIKESEHKFQTYFENSGIASFITDMEGRILRVNDETEQISGFAKSELTGKKLDDFTPDDEKGRLEDLLKEWVKEPRFATKNRKIRLMRRDGTIRDMYISIGSTGQDKNLIMSAYDITDKIYAEREIKDTKQRLTDIIDFLPDATFAVDASGKVVAWNKAMEELTGIPAENILWKGNYEYALPFYGARRPILIDLVRQHDDESGMKEYPGIQKSGNTLHVELQPTEGTTVRDKIEWGWAIATPLLNSRGEITGAIESIRDITGRVRMEQALAEGNERLNVTLRSIGDGVIVTDTKGRVKMLNAVAENLTEWTNQDARKHPIDEVFRIIHEKTGEICENPVEEVLKLGDITNLAKHTTLITRKNRRVSIAESGAPIRRSDGTIIGVVLVFRDVTRDIRSEEKLLTLASIVNSSDDAIIGTTVDGIITNWNNGAKRIYGYSSDDAIGRHVSFIAPPDRKNEFMSIIARITKGERIEHFETVRLNAVGEEINVSITISDLRDENDETIGFSTIARDITEKQKAERALEQHAADLNERVKEINCLYHVSERIGHGGSVAEILQDIVRYIPGGLQYTEKAACRILYRDQKFATPNFRESEHSYAKTVFVLGKDRLSVEVCYTDELKITDHDPFLVEEHRLIDEIADLIVRCIEEKFADEQLIEAKIFAESIIKNVPEVIYSQENDMQISYISPKCLDLFGYPDSAFYEDSELRLALVHPEDSWAVDSILLQIQKGEPYSEEFRIIRKDGPIRWIHDRGIPFMEAAGSLKRIDGSITDITSRKEYESQLYRLAAIVESSDDAIIGKTLDGTIKSWNVGAEKIFGYSESEMIGRNISVIAPHDQKSEIQEILQQISQGERIHHYETKRIGKDGQTLDISLSISPIIDDSGRITGAATISRDITKQKEYEEKLREIAHDLKIRNDELEQFAYVASHDLQEPLRMVASYVQLLKRRYEGKLDDDADEFIDYAVDGANRMQLLINDLLALSRVSTRGKPIQETDSESVLEDALHSLQFQIEESGAAITHDPLPEVFADASQLGQVFQNLVSNAIKFQGEEQARIHISASREGDEWLFSVKDNGIGIKEEYFDRIFVIFQRLHSRADFPGTGIGLAICKKIVERHGGRIWIESKPGAGSTFYFTIPIKPRR